MTLEPRPIIFTDLLDDYLDAKERMDTSTNIFRDTRDTNPGVFIKHDEARDALNAAFDQLKEQK